MRARRSLPAGRLLTEGDLEPLPLVYRGETVQLLLQRGAIEIELRGEAMSDGWLGDHIRVRNPLTRRVMTATVSGGGEVTLQQ